MADVEVDYPCWINVNLDAVGNNTVQVKNIISSDVRLMAVVKSAGYGHGMLSTARTVLARGADALGVTHPDEGVALRGAGIDVPILVFRPHLPGEEDALVSHGLTSSISSFEQAIRLSAAAKRYGQQAIAHIKVETGMYRTGFLPETIIDMADSLVGLPGLEWEGIYTHFAAAADPAFTRHQFHIFNEVVQALAKRGIEFPLRHVCNSAATLLYPEMHLEMVRVGTLLYGQFPAGVKEQRLQLQDTWSFWTRVIHLQEVKRGMAVGYGRTERLRHDTTIAVLPVGYSDGFGVDVQSRPAGFLDLGKVIAKTIMGYLGYPIGWYYVTVNGTQAPIVGRVGMGLTCIDVGKIPDIKVGAPVLLNVRRTGVRESIPYTYKMPGKSYQPGANGIHQHSR